MNARPTLTYDDAVFRQALTRRARRQFNQVTVRDVLDSFWEAGSDLREATLRLGGEELLARAETEIKREVVGQLRWQLEEIGLRLREEIE